MSTKFDRQYVEEEGKAVEKKKVDDGKSGLGGEVDASNDEHM